MSNLGNSAEQLYINYKLPLSRLDKTTAVCYHARARGGNADAQKY